MLRRVTREKRDRVVMFGGSGFVGSRVRELWDADLDLVAPTHAELDVLDISAVGALLDAAQPAAVLNLAAGAHVDASEAERGDFHGSVYTVNAEFPGHLAAVCSERDTYLVHISTDYVFDGTQAARAYREEDPPNPLNWYAETKLAGERLVQEAHPGACVARIEMPFSGRAHARSDFARTCLRRLEAGKAIAGVTDQRITPVFLDDAIRALRRLIAERYAGLIHVAATSWTTPYDYAHAIAERLGLDTELVQATTFAAFSATRPAPRPKYSWLDVSRFTGQIGPKVLRPFEAGLDAWVTQIADSMSRV
jgi:dTDP-4-dehydrorhamnose reductase